MNQFAKAAVGSIGKTENEYNPPPMRNTSSSQQAPRQQRNLHLKDKKWVLQVV